jgi:hypothetical protein
LPAYAGTSDKPGKVVTPAGLVVGAQFEPFHASTSATVSGEPVIATSLKALMLLLPSSDVTWVANFTFVQSVPLKRKISSNAGAGEPVSVTSEISPTVKLAAIAEGTISIVTFLFEASLATTIPPVPAGKAAIPLNSKSLPLVA